MIQNYISLKCLFTDLNWFDISRTHDHDGNTNSFFPISFVRMGNHLTNHQPLCFLTST